MKSRKPNPASTNNTCLYGRRPVLEVLRAQRRAVHEVLVLDTLRHAETLELRALAQELRLPVRTATSRELDQFTQGGHHQGFAALCGGFPYTGINDVMIAVQKSETPPLVLLVDCMEDPQNFGSLLRTAAAVDATAVLIPTDRAVGVTPAAVRASAGFSEVCRVARVTNLVQTVKELQKAGLWITGLDTGDGARPYTRVDFTGPVGLVVGGEGRGLRRLVRESCDFIAEIPMPGPVESLNAGVAGALCLYEILRQRGAPHLAPGK